MAHFGAKKDEPVAARSVSKSMGRARRVKVSESEGEREQVV